MKGIITTLLALIITFSAIAQEKQLKKELIGDGKLNFFEIQERAEKYFKEKSPDENGTISTAKKKGGEKEREYKDYYRYKRWEHFWRDRVLQDGSFPDPLLYRQSKEFKKNTALRTTGTAALKWENISQRTSPGGYTGMGRATAIAFHPTDKNIFYVGAPAGGIWKTTDGGNTYTSIGEDLPYVGVGNIVVDYRNPNNIYITIGDHTGWWNYGLGVYKSTDGGITWNPTTLSRSFTDEEAFLSMVIHPTDPLTLFVGASKGLYKTRDGGATWDRVQNGHFNDIEFKPTNPTIMYASTWDYWNPSQIYKSQDSGNSWTQITSLTYNDNTLRIAVTPANPNMVAFSGSEDRTVYVSTDNANSFATHYYPEKNEGIFYISPSNASWIYNGFVHTLKSEDMGANWKLVTHWRVEFPVPVVHADNRFVGYNPLEPGYLYFCNDGGVYKMRESDNTWKDYSNGLIITQFYKIAHSQNDPMKIIGGTQDNGGRKRLADGTWGPTNGGDAMEVAIDQSNDNIIYSTYIFGQLYRSTDYWTHDVTDIRENIPGKPRGDWVTPYVLDPNNNSTIIAGYAVVYRSTDRGNSWTAISDSLGGGKNYLLHNVAVAPSNSNVIYATRESSLYRTENLGGSWQTYYGPFWNRITSITVHPTNPNKIWITQAGYTYGYKVFYSEDGGANWTNVSYNLPNVPVNAMAYEKGSNDGLYIGTDAGVFYKNNSMSSWILFGDDLPNTIVSDIEIHYATKKVRIGTYGRGIWETGLYASDNNQAPTVAISAPSNNASFNAPANITLTAVASDTDGTIAKVEFFEGTRSIGESSISPYTINWSNVAAGNYQITAKATDNGGKSTTSGIVNVIVNQTTAKAIPGRIQAENWDAMYGVQVETTSDIDGVQNVGWIDNGDYMDYNVNVATAGSYQISFRVASAPGGGVVELRKGASVLATANIASTGNWQNWATVTASANLTAGAQTLRVYAATGGWNINWIEFAASAKPTVNLALNKPATASSTENASLAASLAVDGNTGTRWASQYSDPQWLTVNLGASYTINRVKITWEAAYGRDYQIQISNNGSTWSPLKSVTSNSALVNDFTDVSGTAQYIRIYGTARGTAYGYSIYELEVYGSSTSSRLTFNENNTVPFRIYPSLVEQDELSIEYNGLVTKVSYSIIDNLGISKLNGSTLNNKINIGALRPGVYTIVLTEGNNRSVKHFIKK